ERGLHVDWSAFDAPFDRRPCVLPTYPFQRERYWVEGLSSRASAFDADRDARGGAHPLLGRPIPLAGTKEVRFATRLGPRAPAFLAEHRVLGSTLLPGSCYVEMALRAAREASGREGPIELSGFGFERPLTFSEAEERSVQSVLSSEAG